MLRRRVFIVSYCWNVGVIVLLGSLSIFFWYRALHDPQARRPSVECAIPACEGGAPSGIPGFGCRVSSTQVDATFFDVNPEITVARFEPETATYLLGCVSTEETR